MSARNFVEVVERDGELSDLWRGTKQLMGFLPDMNDRETIRVAWKAAKTGAARMLKSAPRDHVINRIRDMFYAEDDLRLWLSVNCDTVPAGKRCMRLRTLMGLEAKIFSSSYKREKRDPKRRHEVSPFILFT